MAGIELCSFDPEIHNDVGKGAFPIVFGEA
jgi:hypothetical protein